MNKDLTNCCFVMMPFSTPSQYDDDSHFQKIYDQVFVPAIKRVGYEPYRVDENKLCDSIVTKIFGAVRKCPMALCDLSSRNPNVLYELGLRQAYNMPVVLVQDDITERIFDVSGISTVTYKNHRLVENVEDAINAINEALKQTKEGQNQTLAHIVKAKEADYESISVSGDERIHIALMSIMSDIKELKSRERADADNFPVEREEISILPEINVLVENGITNKDISRILDKYADVIMRYKRNGNIVKITLKSMGSKEAFIWKKRIGNALLYGNCTER